MKKVTIVSAIVCMSVFMSVGFDSVAQNDTPATVNATTDDDADDDNGNWGLLGLAGLLGLLGLRRKDDTHTTRTTSTRPLS
jgi:MYXO-CTERM domain-containing protein